MNFIIQTSIILAALYYIPWLGDLEARSKLVLIVPVSAVLSLAVFWVFDLLRAPTEIDRAQASDLAEMRDAIISVNEDNRVIGALSNLVLEGVATQDYEGWRGKVGQYLLENTNATAVHAFNIAGVLPALEGGEAHRARVGALNHICKTGGSLSHAFNFSVSALADKYSKDGPEYLSMLGVPPDDH